MFTFSWVLFISLASWAILALVAFTSNSPLAVGLRPRMTTLMGVALILGGFFQPWLSFEFLRYLRIGPGIISDILPEILQWLGPEPLAGLLKTLERITHLNAWQIQLVPFYNLKIRLIALAPILLALGAMVWVPWGASLAGRGICKIAGAFQVSLSLVTLLMLTLALPDLEALGQPVQLPWSLLGALLGVRLGGGIWLTLIGLCALSIGGAVEIFDPGPGYLSDKMAEAGL